MRDALSHSLTAETRAARPDEAEATLTTLCSAFGLNADAARPIFYADPYYDLSHKRVRVLPGAGIVSCLTVIPTTVLIGGVPVPAGGIAGVATRPDQQGRGHARALLQSTLPALWDELGYPLSLLYAESPSLYRRLSWETASDAVRWAASPASLPAHPDSAHVRPAAPSDWPAIYALHRRLTQTETGAFVRDERRWRLIQMPVFGREAFVYDSGAGVMGYLIWERQETLTLMEMHGLPEAAAGLVSFLARQPEPRIEWQTSPAHLRAFGLPPTNALPEPGVMLRITDLKAALAAVQAARFAPLLEASGSTLTLQAADSLRPDNERPLTLTAHGITPAASLLGAWLQTDLSTLGQFYFGYRLPSDAASHGLVRTDSPQTLALADRLFPLRTPYIAPLDQF